MAGNGIKAMDRRGALRAAAKGAALLAGGAVLSAVPGAGRVFAQPLSADERHRRILDIAKREVERNRAHLWRTDMAAIADFGLPSSLPRLHFANLEKGEVRSFLVAHGKGSDPEHDGFLKNFSNVVGSNATSQGAFVTYEWYTGKYGTSIRLGGVDQTNNHALERLIVMHPAWYAAPDMLTKWGKLGRSDGCFAMDPEQFNEALWHLSGGRLLFADRLGIS